MLFDHRPVGLEPRARAFRCGDMGLTVDEGRGRHQVVRVVAVRRRNVVRVDVVGKGRDGNVVPAQRARIHHSAAPAADVVTGGKFLNAARFREAAHARHLDVDDLAASELDSTPRVVDRVDAFVEHTGVRIAACRCRWSTMSSLASGCSIMRRSSSSIAWKVSCSRSIGATRTPAPRSSAPRAPPRLRPSAGPHGDHVDYLVDGALHHLHGDHCDLHGTV